MYKVVTGSAVLDRETQSEHRLQVTCRDAGQSALHSAVTSLVVMVSDLNDNAPYFQSREYQFLVAENNAIGQSVGHVTAEDRDLGENARLDYVITGGDLVSTVNFRLDGESGELRAVVVLDHETAPRDGFHFQVRLASSQTLHCQTTDVALYVHRAVCL